MGGDQRREQVGSPYPQHQRDHVWNRSAEQGEGAHRVQQIPRVADTSTYQRLYGEDDARNDTDHGRPEGDILGEFHVGPGR
ncbi:MAG: hypothetical protein CME13_15705 [Gemmatimonadetes bacterium]|nr:hypothetical protein [Gemmatimonadota bacterium]HCV24874.1 hypothetical protein [Candidatus Latescibacterota bacterium]